jgi:hypothetical protein
LRVSPDVRERGRDGGLGSANGSGDSADLGSVGQPQQTTDSPGRLIWPIRLVDGLMAEMWTYQQSQPSR